MNNVITKPDIVDPLITDWTDGLDNLQEKTIGNQGLNISNYNNDLEPEILTNSFFEANGHFYNVTADTPVTGWSGIANESIVWLEFNYGLQIFDWATPAYAAFDSERAGYYDGDNRLFFQLYKDITGNWTQKARLSNTVGAVEVATVDLNVWGNAAVAGDIESAIGDFRILSSGDATITTFNATNSISTGNLNATNVNTTGGTYVGGTVYGGPGIVMSPSNSTYGTWSIGSGATLVIPAGAYMVQWNKSTDIPKTQCYVNTSWQGEQAVSYGYMTSDGINKRFWNTFGSAATCYYRKFIV